MVKYYLICGSLLFATLANAQVYKWVDSEGRVNYSSTPPKGQKAESVDLRPSIEVSVPKSAPRDANERPGEGLGAAPLAAESSSNNIMDQLDSDIAAEKEAIAKAKEDLAEAENNPMVFKTTIDGKTVTRRNVAAYESNVRNAQANLAEHEANLKRLMEQKTIIKVPMPPIKVR